MKFYSLLEWELNVPSGQQVHVNTTNGLEHLSLPQPCLWSPESVLWSGFRIGEVWVMEDKTTSYRERIAHKYGIFSLFSAYE